MDTGAELLKTHFPGSWINENNLSNSVGSLRGGVKTDS